MANTGWHFPGSSQSGAPYTGDYTWTNHAYIKANDSNYAKCSMLVNGADSYGESCRAYSFGFSADISASASIDGIYARVYRYVDIWSYSNRTYDHQVRLDTGGTVRGNNKSTGSLWPTSFAYKYYGGSSDLWGYSFTASQVRASSFGFSVRPRMDYGSAKEYNDAYIDFMQVNVYFTEPPAAPTNCTATQEDNGDVTVAWTDNATDEDYYEVSVSVNGGAYSILSATIPANSTSYTDSTGYSHGDTLDYRVRALKSAGPDSTYANAPQITYDTGTHVECSPATITYVTKTADVVAATDVDCSPATITYTPKQAVAGLQFNTQALAGSFAYTTHRATVYHGPELFWAREDENITP